MLCKSNINLRPISPKSDDDGCYKCKQFELYAKEYPEQEKEVGPIHMNF